MISEKTFDFLVQNKLMNSREWYADHKEDYRKYVVEPLAELTEQLAPTMDSIDSQIVTIPKINKVLSRICRDTRFSRDKSLYRDSAWMSFKRDKKACPQYPEFFVVMTPEQYLYGCGYYAAKPDTMQSLREMIVSDDKVYLDALKAYKKQSFFKIEGDKMKRTKYPDCSEEKRDWLDRKNICFTAYSTDYKMLFSDKIAEKLSDEFLTMKPVYEMLIRAEQKAAGIIK